MSDGNEYWEKHLKHVMSRKPRVFKITYRKGITGEEYPPKITVVYKNRYEIYERIDKGTFKDHDDYANFVRMCEENEKEIHYDDTIDVDLMMCKCKSVEKYKDVKGEYFVGKNCVCKLKDKNDRELEEILVRTVFLESE